MFILIKQTGRQVVVVIDEYDAPLLDVIHDSEVLDKVRNVMQEFYQHLKCKYLKRPNVFIKKFGGFKETLYLCTV